MKDKIEIKKDLIPYTFDILLAGEIFNIRVDYNRTADLFILQLKKDNKIICSGEPIIYNVPLFQDVFISGEYPALRIVPTDESKDKDKVTYDNLGTTIFLVVDNGGGDSGE